MPYYLKDVNGEGFAYLGFALWSGNWQRKEDAKGNFKLNTKGFPDSGCVALSSSLAGKRRKPHCWKHESLLNTREILS